MAWLPNGEKILKIYLFVLTEFTNVTDGRTDTQTPHDNIGCACIASRGKNQTVFAEVMLK